MAWDAECQIVATVAYRNAVTHARRLLRSGAPALVAALHAKVDSNLSAKMVRDLGSLDTGLDTFLETWGHRADSEMEISLRRWSEDPTQLGRHLGRACGRTPTPPRPETLAAIPTTKRDAFDREIDLSRRYHGLRGTLRNAGMIELAHIRALLLSFAERIGLGRDIFYLDPGELEGVARGKDLSSLAKRRRRERQAWLDVPMPQVIFSDDLTAVGTTESTRGEQRFECLPVSPGFARGPARIVGGPSDTLDLTGEEILVLPSSDPSFAFLYPRCKGIVFERGRLLSHGAVLARDFGIPTVANILGIGRLVRRGETLTLDGEHGLLYRGSAETL
jgi:pyruvate,water dikinase